MTETLNCEPDLEISPVFGSETEFEKRRGVSNTEIKHGFAQVHVSQLMGDIMPARIRILRAVANADISLDFLKLTPTGLSFLVPSARATSVEKVLTNTEAIFHVRLDRSIVTVHAVNIRDEEGLIALVMREAIAQGTTIDHVGDMHDRLLLVVSEADALKLRNRLQTRLDQEANHAH